jgi:hypothetical protein
MVCEKGTFTDTDTSTLSERLASHKFGGYCTMVAILHASTLEDWDIIVELRSIIARFIIVTLSTRDHGTGPGIVSHVITKIILTYMHIYELLMFFRG